MGIIPARAGSKRIINKNKRLLAGKELIRYAIEAATGSKLMSRVVVNTDDEDILKIALEYQGIEILRRPKDISGDEALAITYVKHTLENVNEDFDIVVIIQVSSPFTQSEDIDNTIQKLIDTGADSCVSAMKLDHAIHPAKLKKLTGDRLIPYLQEEKGRMSSHELSEIYIRNGAVYASQIGVYLGGNIIGDDCRAYIMPRERSIDINDPIDIEFAEFLMQKYER